MEGAGGRRHHVRERGLGGAEVGLRVEGVEATDLADGTGRERRDRDADVVGLRDLQDDHGAVLGETERASARFGQLDREGRLTDGELEDEAVVRERRRAGSDRELQLVVVHCDGDERRLLLRGALVLPVVCHFGHTCCSFKANLDRGCI